MKLPINWLSDYIETNKSSKELAESLTLLGLLLDKPIENNEYTQILDLEHRMDRSDWLSVLGCARDLAAFEDLELIAPEVHTEKGKEGGGVRIEVQCPDLVNRFNTRVFRGVKVAPSPDWLAQRLESYGIPSINNIVDITNFVMVELGQPMHAQDLAKMEAQEIVIRKAKKGEKILTLLGETVELDESMFVLTQNDKPTVIGGIVGGKSTGVDATTTDIVLDAGNYNQVSVRQSSRKLKIQNETVLRYDKFLHPKLTEIAIQRATKLILELAGGEYYENYDWYPNEIPQQQLSLRFSRIEQVGGISPEAKTVKNILEKLEYQIDDQNEEGFKLTVPYFRTDVTVEDDIVADILRISNYQNIETKRLSMAPPKEITPSIYKFENKLRQIMLSLGAHEHITDPLVAKEAHISGLTPIHLENALTQDKASLRSDIEQNLNTIKGFYIKNKKTLGKLYEVGKIYHEHDEELLEERILEFLCFEQDKKSVELNRNVKTLLMSLLSALGVKQKEVSLKKIENSPKAQIKINDQVIGVLKVTGFTIYTEKLLDAIEINTFKNVKSQISNVSTVDLSLKINADVQIGKIYSALFEIEQINKIDVIERYSVDTVLLRVFFHSTDNSETVEKIKSVINKSTGAELKA